MGPRLENNLYSNMWVKMITCKSGAAVVAMFQGAQQPGHPGLFLDDVELPAQVGRQSEDVSLDHRVDVGLEGQGGLV